MSRPARRVHVLDKQGRTEANRLYALTGAFPDLPGGVLLALARGEITPEVDGDKLIIEVEEGCSGEGS